MNKFQRKRIERLKNKFVNFDLLNSVNNYFRDSKKQYLIKTKNRSSNILPCFVNLVIYVYNGKKYIPFYVIKDYLGHKFGEFIYTRRFVGHKKSGKKLMFKKKIIKKTKYFKYIKSVKFGFSMLSKKKLYKTLKKKKTIKKTNEKKN